MLDRLEFLLSSATRVPATRRAIVEMDKLLDVVDKMRVAVPQDVRDAEAVLEKRETILDQVLVEARSVRQAAEEESQRLVEESHVSGEAQKQVEKLLTDAQERAQQMLEDAEGAAAERRKGADAYIRESLSKLETELTGVLDMVRRGMNTLQG